MKNKRFKMKKQKIIDKKINQYFFIKWMIFGLFTYWFIFIHISVLKDSIEIVLEEDIIGVDLDQYGMPSINHAKFHRFYGILYFTFLILNFYLILNYVEKFIIYIEKQRILPDPGDTKNIFETITLHNLSIFLLVYKLIILVKEIY